MAKVELKQPIIEEITKNVEAAKAVVLVDYRGLTVEQDTKLRKSLREGGVDDATAPARLLADAMKTADKLEFKGGVVDGTYYDANGCQVVATIPSREVLISKLLGSLQSPIANIARVIKQIAEKKGEVA